MTGLPRLGIGIQVITRDDLLRASARGRKVGGFWIGWTHLSHGVTRELADQALGRVVTIGARTGFGRLGRSGPQEAPRPRLYQDEGTAGLLG
jgi:hypothetical protein